MSRSSINFNNEKRQFKKNFFEEKVKENQKRKSKFFSEYLTTSTVNNTHETTSDSNKFFYTPKAAKILSSLIHNKTQTPILKNNIQQNSSILTKSLLNLSRKSKYFDNSILQRKNTENKFFKNTEFEEIFKKKLKGYNDAKFSNKENGVIVSYGANTNQGKYRISIILNVIKPPSRKNETWPTISFFGIFDGHKGSKCAELLRDNLHQEKCFPYDTIKAIKKGCTEFEKDFIAINYDKLYNESYDQSGSCAVFAIIVGNICYVANIGDSRVLYSESLSRKVYCLTNDHKPNNLNEKNRIIEAGGHVYHFNVNINNNLPCRIFPGKLTVSRAFGNLEAKLPELGGNNRVLIAEPEIVSFKLNEESDFIFLGSDGIFDSLSNAKIIEIIWESFNSNIKGNTVYKHAGITTDLIMKMALNGKSKDNVSAIFVCFDNFRQNYFEEKFHYIIHSNVNCLSESNILKKNCENLDFFDLLINKELNLLKEESDNEETNSGDVGVGRRSVIKSRRRTVNGNVYGQGVAKRNSNFPSLFIEKLKQRMSLNFPKV